MLPHKTTSKEAMTACQAHGAVMYVPKDAVENRKLVEILTPHKYRCNDQDSKSVAWLGIKAINQTWYHIGKGKKLSIQEYTNWTTSPYYSNYECGFFKTDGSWGLDKSTFNCNTFLRLCTVCKLEGNKIGLLLCHSSGSGSVEVENEAEVEVILN